jgi:hypothetical protein
MIMKTGATCPSPNHGGKTPGLGRERIEITMTGTDMTTVAVPALPLRGRKCPLGRMLVQLVATETKTGTGTGTTTIVAGTEITTTATETVTVTGTVDEAETTLTMRMTLEVYVYTKDILTAVTNTICSSNVPRNHPGRRTRRRLLALEVGRERRGLAHGEHQQGVDGQGGDCLW